MAICLPFEILAAIFEEVEDVRDLWLVRRASRTLCAAATPFAFRVLSVVSPGGNPQNLGRLFDIPDIAAHVREIAYRDTGTDGTRRGGKPEYVRTSVIHDSELATSFSRVHQLPQLETINLTFYPSYGNQLAPDAEARLALQESIVGALAASFSICAPPKLRSLSLCNLRTSDLSSPLESPPFQTVLTTLRSLQLSVLDSASNPKTPLVRWRHFWGILCPRMILAPMQHTLTELTLHSGVLVGAWSGLSFAGLHFPRLSALSLRKFVFEPSVGAEDFILQHGATLARLELLWCMLPIDSDRLSYPSTDIVGDDDSNPPAFWERTWDLFAVELTALVALHVDERCRGHTGPALRYAYPSTSLSCVVANAFDAPRNVADAEALQRLHMIVAARSEEARGES